MNVVESTSHEAVDAAERFLEKWPESELRAAVAQQMMEACTTVGNRKCAVAAGRKSLEMASENVHVLVMLANLLPNQSSSLGRV